MTMPEQANEGTNIELDPGTAIQTITPLPEKDIAVTSLVEEVNRIHKWAEDLKIQSKEDIEAATNDLSILANLRKAVATKRLEYTGPIKLHLATIEASFKAIIEPLEGADRLYRDKVTAFYVAEEARRVEAEKVERAKAEVARLETELKAKEQGKEVSEIPATEPEKMPSVQEVSKRTEADLGSSNMRDNWTYEITDFSKLPDEYKLPNTSMLAAKARTTRGTQEVPGVKFVNRPIMVVRPK